MNMSKSGNQDLTKTEILKTPQFSRFGGLVSIIKNFGGKNSTRESGKRLRKDDLFGITSGILQQNFTDKQGSQ